MENGKVFDLFGLKEVGMFESEKINSKIQF
jgi:hypothetical protein